MNRRQSLASLAAFVAVLGAERAGRATMARAVSLKDLVARSTRAVRGTPLDSFARAEQIGPSRHIVTYTRLRVEESVFGASGERELLVRTLGGRLGKLGEIVHGEAALTLHEDCLLFTQPDAFGIDQVTAMAQGHYPVSTDGRGTLRLSSSNNLPRLVAAPGAAVEALAGSEFVAARALILGARR